MHILEQQHIQLRKIDNCRWEIPCTGAMRVPGKIFSSEKMIDTVVREQAAAQVANVATLPGIVGASLAMPDIHWGYGFCIGGVAAFDCASGVISPGGVGYDINCGVRLLRTNLQREEVLEKIKVLVGNLFTAVPSGVGSTGRVGLAETEVADVLNKGAAWAIKKGYGTQADCAHTEEQGCVETADARCVSRHALERGREQLGTLGAGNHFLEVQYVDTIYDTEVARVFGLQEGQVTVMIHTGSRGLGYQICDDYIRELHTAVARYNIALPDRQLVCAPVDSPEGKKYFAAMCCGANYAWANRQMITHWVRQSFQEVFGQSLSALGLELVYDVAHNIAKRETHQGRMLMVHRKGATRAFAAGHPDIPSDYRAVGQPVIIPGTMGTESYVLAGTPGAMQETFGSTCHGAGRVMSRTQAMRTVRGQVLAEQLQEQGITVQSESWKTLAEETPVAYKDVAQVVNICESAGISKKVARLKPMGVIKG